MSQPHTHRDHVTFQEAIKSPHWITVVNEELSALEENQTWDITTLPPGKKPIGTKWLFKTKYLPDGSVERYKARLVVLGNKQTLGIDYAENFALVSKLTTFRALLALASLNKWHLSQMDVKKCILAWGS